MIFTEALRSLRYDKVKAFFYWLTLTFATAFMALYFNIAMDESVGLSLGQSSSNIITVVTLIAVMICCVDVFFANDYYTKNKSKDLAIRLISGATYTHIAGFLLIQTCLMMGLAIPCGYAIARFMMPVITNYLHSTLNASYTIQFVKDGVIYTNVMLAFIVGWIVVLNLSFTYINTASTLVNQKNAVKGKKGGMFYLGTVPLWLQQAAWAFLFLMPLVMFHINRDAIVLFACIGMAGLNGVLSCIITPLFTRLIFHGNADPLRISVLGFLREDLQSVKYAIYLLLVSVIIMASILVSQDTSSLAYAAILLSYIFLSVLQAMALMFRFATELSDRPRLFASLAHIGYTDRQLHQIVTREVIAFYGSIILTALLYLLNIYISLVRAGRLVPDTAVLLTLCFVIPLFIAMIGSLIYYRKLIFQGKEKEETASE